MGIVDNFKKVSRLYRISLVFKQADAGSSSSKREEAIGELFELLESGGDLKRLLDEKKAGREELRVLFDLLCENAGVWVKSNYVPASSLAFAKPLQYVLNNAEDLKGSEERKKKICARLVSYFRDNEIGEVREYHPRKKAKAKLANS